MSDASGILASLAGSLANENVDELQQYISDATHLDLSAAWASATQKNDSANSTAICKAISQVLIRIDGEKGFASPGSAFIRRILNEHSRAILRNLSSLRPMYVNPTLRLLITMAQFDAGALANEVYLALEFATFKILPKLLIRTGTRPWKDTTEKVSLGKRKRDDSSSKDAIRSLFTALLFTLLKNVPPTSKAEILQRRPVMTELIKYLPTDSTESVIKTIKGLANVLESREIPRPAKIQFFNENTLSVLSSLYERNDRTRDDEDDTGTIDQTKSNSSAILSDTLRAFFIKATTVPDQGVCFASQGLVPPPNKRLYNPILASFITALRPLDNLLHSELLLQIFQSTPELVAHWMQSTNIDFTPRLDEQWIKSMQLIDSIASLPLPSGTVGELDRIPDFVLLENLMPSPLERIATKGVQHESSLVRLMTHRTLNCCLRRIQELQVESDRAAFIKDLVQRRTPLIEHTLPTAGQAIREESPEEEVLLRTEALITLSYQVRLFEDLPSFDFVGLFNMIMTASVSLPGHSSQKNTSSIATVTEQELVLQMAGHIDGIQWLVRKKGGHSIFWTVMYNCSCRPLVESHAALEMLYKIILDDSIAFSRSDTSAPVCKLEAIISAISPANLKPSDPILIEILDFVEDCMIRFQAAPYKYWDHLEKRADNLSSTSCETSCSLILLTIEEQIAFVTDKKHISNWARNLVALLTAVGERPDVSASIASGPMPVLDGLPTSILWLGVATVHSLVGNFQSVSASRLSDEVRNQFAQQWEVCNECLSMLVGPQRTNFIRYLVDRVFIISQNNEDSAMSTAMLRIVVTNFNADDVSSNEKLYHLIIALLWSADTSSMSLGTLLSHDLALKIIANPRKQWKATESNLKGALLECFSNSAPVVSRLTVVPEFLSPGDFRNERVVSSLTKAISTGLIEKFPLDYVLSDAFLLSDNEVVEVEKDISIDGCQSGSHGFAGLLSTYIQCYNIDDIPYSVVHWARKASFSAASPLIAELLKSGSQELCESGHQLLSLHSIDIKSMIEDSAEVSGTACTCIHASTADTTARATYYKQAVETMPMDIGLGLNKMKILTSLGDATNMSAEYLGDELSEYHVNVINLLTRSFAENRVQEEKEIDPETLHYLTFASEYLSISNLMVMHAGKTSLNLLVEAGLENQSHHPEVLSFFNAIAVSATGEEAFNYARSMQSLLNTGNVLREEKTRLAAIRLLHTLVQHDPLKANINVFDEVIKLHQGTLAPDDRLLFEMLCTLESSLKVSFGTRIKSWRFVEAESETFADTKGCDAVLSSELALNTILHFTETVDTAFTTHAVKVYDIRWALALVAGFLQSDTSIAMMKQLMEHHALGLAFIGLSSKEAGTRLRASLLLSKFHKLVLSSTIREKYQLETLLSVTRDSISSTDLGHGPVPLIQSIFLALAAHILLNPAHYLYEKLNRFLLARPQLDLTDIPMFLNLFNSHDNYAKDVTWSLRLLAAGIRDGEEAAYRRRHVLEMSMGLYRSPTATAKIKEGIRDVLRKSLEVPGMRWYFDRVGGRTWLHMDQEPELADFRDGMEV